MKKIKRVKLHNTAFIGGTNLQMDLDSEKRIGLKIIDDEDKNKIYVYFNKEYAEIPYANVSVMIPADQGFLKALFDSSLKEASAVVQQAAPQKAKPKTSQVSSPMDHVHSGLGAGKTRD